MGIMFYKVMVDPVPNMDMETGPLVDLTDLEWRRLTLSS
jgi:hypothetical protein